MFNTAICSLLTEKTDLRSKASELLENLEEMCLWYSTTCIVMTLAAQKQ